MTERTSRPRARDRAPQPGVVRLRVRDLRDLELVARRWRKTIPETMHDVLRLGLRGLLPPEEAGP